MNNGGVDWDAVRAEYLAGEIGCRKLAEKHGIPYQTIRDRATREQWTRLRREAREKSGKKAVQKAADLAAKNAAAAQRIRGKLLARLEKEIDRLPDAIIGSESRNMIEAIERDKKGRPIKKMVQGKTHNLRELAATLKELSAGVDMETGVSSPDDGFLQALSSTAMEDWHDGGV